MSAYVIVDNHILDQEGYAEYISKVTSTVEEYGGRYLVRGGKIILHDSEWSPGRLIVIEFDDAEQARQWVESAEVAPLHAMRKTCADSRMIIVEGC